MPDVPSTMMKTSFILLWTSKLRFIMTVSGISLCVLLIGFLVGIYRGVSVGSVEFVRSSPCDVWVLQHGTTNILRGFSLLTVAHGLLIEEIPDTRSVAPVLFRLSTVEIRGTKATTYVTGFDPRIGAGGPPALYRGRGVRRSGEIVLDRSFARQWSCDVGDTARIMDLPFVVTGLSTGSNMFAIQYAFVHIEDVRRLYGVSDLVSAFLVRLESESDVGSFVSYTNEEIPGVSAYGQEEFLRLNIAEMENGFLPIILVIMTISSLLLTVIIGLLLTMNVLEYRREFAVLKAIGSPSGFLPLLVTIQSFQLVGISSVLSLLLGYPLLLVVEALIPIVDVSFAPLDIALIVLILCFLVAVGAIFPLLRMRSIYPIEAFR